MFLSVRFFAPNVVTNGFIPQSRRLFQAVAGDSEECSLGTAIHYQKIRGGGICDAFHWGGGGVRLWRTQNAQSQITFFF